MDAVISQQHQHACMQVPLAHATPTMRRSARRLLCPRPSGARCTLRVGLVSGQQNRILRRAYILRILYIRRQCTFPNRNDNNVTTLANTSLCAGGEIQTRFQLSSQVFWPRFALLLLLLDRISPTCRKGQTLQGGRFFHVSFVWWRFPCWAAEQAFLLHCTLAKRSE